MENKRASWGSNLGFIMAAIGSAVGLGNIWGFPYKMGRSGGFMFLIIYILLAVFVGMVIMSSELALGRRTRTGVVGAYRAVSKKFKWVGWLGILSPFLIMSFYSVLGGYCFQYMSLNMAELSFGLSSIFGASIDGAITFGSMLTSPFGCAVFTLLFLGLCMVIVKGGVSEGIEKFNKIGMPALFVMLIVVIIRSVTLPHAEEGLKYMFVPGYAVAAGFTDETPSLISVLATAGGQMFFSLSLAMGAMIMALMVGWELKPALLLDEIHNGEHSAFFSAFYTICIKFICPVVMAFVLAGQLIDFFLCPQTEGYIQPLCYGVSGVLLVMFWAVAATGKKTANV